jgi:hypothetical protein
MFNPLSFELDVGLWNAHAVCFPRVTSEEFHEIYFEHFAIGPPPPVSWLFYIFNNLTNVTES